MKQRLRRSVGVVLGLGLALFFAALALPYPGSRAAGETLTGAAGQDVVFFVATNGVHTDLILPRSAGSNQWDDFLSVGEVTRKAPERATHLMFGWGERNFYFRVREWADLTPGYLVDFLVGTSTSVVHVAAVYGLKQSADVRAVTVSAAAYHRLTDKIRAAFALDGRGRPRRIAAGYDWSDAFFEGAETYSLGHNCNNWTSDGLRAAGVSTPLWGGMAFAVMAHLP